MSTTRRLLTCLLGPLLFATTAVAADIELIELDNGLEVLLREAHGSEMVASIVTIGAGSRFEDEATFGSSHFLEHMVFNGTSLRTREDINEGIKAYGGYINAFTRRDYTCFILMIPSEFLREGLAIQADMLFDSTLPEEEFAKERLVVIEEMNKDYDSGSYRGDLFRNETLMAGTPYASPILGTVETISSLSRQRVLDYYRERYRPDNCRIYLMGDFEKRQTLHLLDELFGEFTDAPVPEMAPVSLGWPEEGEYTLYRAEEGAPQLDLYWQVPGIAEGQYPAQAVLTGILENEYRSPLSNGEGGRLDLGLSIEQYEDFAICHMNLDPGERSVEEGLGLLADRLRGLVDWAPDADLVRDVARGQRFDDVLLRDTFHFFAMMASPDLHYGGYDYLSGSDQALRELTPAAITRALRTSLLASAPRIIYSTVAEGSGTLPDKVLAAFPRLPAAVEGDVAFSVKPRYRSRNLEREKRAKRSRTAKIVTKRVVLSNGLTVLIKSDPAGEVFASHLLIRGRSAMEPEGRAGIVTLAHELLKAGAAGRSEEEIEAEITRLGLRLKTVDNPWIPFDDYYSREDFSWLRLECLDESGLAALALLADLVGGAEYPETAVSAAKARMMGALRGGMRPSSQAQESLYSHVFEGSTRGMSIKGTPGSIMSITAADLREFHGRYFDPRRMVLSVVSGLPVRKVLQEIERQFGDFESGVGEIGVTVPNGGPVEIRVPMDKTQVTILGGQVIPDWRSLEAGLPVLVDVLSTRMALELREKQGLAYSLGAGLRVVPGLNSDDPGFALLSFQISTAAGNRERAVEGILTELQHLADEPPTEEEVFLSVNDSWGRGLMRNLSRIHQAYQMGLNAHLGLDPFGGRGDRVRRQRKLTAEELATLANDYLLKPNWVWVYAGGGL
ncbi:MAG: insulinase family protein [bacterium]|nr:insulinase family protein [bacterium]